jgi:WD40 repeat protein/serine/threonine protein kinase
MSQSAFIGSAPLSIAALLADQDQRWQQGERVLVEDYLRDQLALHGEPGSILDLIYHEIVLREERGEQANLDGYLRRFPQFSEDLRLHFEVHAALLPVSKTFAGHGPSAGARADAPQPPVVLPAVPGYELLGVIGRGGMGIVYKARHEGLNRLVALKMLGDNWSGDADRLARFRAEAEAVARLQSPHIVQIHDIGGVGGHLYFALEFIDGGNLAERLKGSPVPQHQAAALVEILARAMHHAHERGIVHRDLKPANILLASGQVVSGELSSQATDAVPLTSNHSSLTNYQPKITDFGLAKFLEDSPSAAQTHSGDILGTPSYMAPEQTSGVSNYIGPATDTYALGTVLYEMLTGRPPFQGVSSLDTMQQVRLAMPVPPRRLQPGIAVDLETICLKCLEKAPGKRYSTALALADDLARFLAGRPIKARAVGQVEKLWRWCRRNPSVAALGAGICLILALGFAGVIWQWREAEAARTTAEDRLYFNRIALAHQAWRGYQVGPADRILDECIPTSGQEDRRSWEWRYLRRLCRSSVLTLPGHHATVKTVAYSPDGRLLASCSGEWREPAPGELMVWDAQNGELLHTFQGHVGAVNHLAFAPDGRLMASAGSDATVRLWNLARPQDPAVVLKHQTQVMHVDFSPRSGLLAAGCSDQAVYIWDVSERKLLRIYREHPDNVFAVAFHPTESLIASGGRGGEAIRLWDPATGANLRLLPWAADVRCLAFSADGKFLAAGSYQGAMKVWDLTREDSEPVTYKLYAGPVGSIALSPDSRRLALCTGSGRVQIIELRDGEEVQTVRGHDGAVQGVAFSPDGRRLATAGGDHYVRVWDTAAPQELQSVLQRGGWIYDCAFSPDGKSVALARGVSQSTVSGVKLVDVWDLEKRTWGKQFRWTDYLTSVAYGSNQLAAGSEDGTVVVWDVATGALQHALKGHRGVVTGVAYTPDGRQLASAGADGTVRIWDTSTGQEGRIIPGNDTPLSGVAYSPDGTLLAATGADPAIRLWDAATGREVHTLRGHDATVSCVTFSPDGRWLASADLYQLVRIWDVRTGKELTPSNEPIRLEGPAPDKQRMPWDHFRPVVPRIAFSADSRRLASINGKQPIQVWDVVTRLPAFTLPATETGFTCLAFSRDGRWLVGATGAWLHIWDAGSTSLQ